MRRRGPLLSGAAVLAIVAGLIASGTPDPWTGVATVSTGWALFWLGRWLALPWSLPVAVVAAVLLQTRTGPEDEVPVLLFSLMPYLAGCGVRSRDLVARQLDERVAELDAEREVYAELSVRYERARIASELHDIVAHAMSVMVVQAGAGQRLAGVDADATGEAFTAISEAARQAEADMHRLVALLSEHEVAASPDLGVVEELVRRAAGSGLDVTLRLEGEREGLAPSTVDLAYAVVRESLTNALRYAAGASARVRIDGAGDELVVEVTNGPAPRAAALEGHGTGSGLQGLRDRIAEADGRLQAGPTPGGGWAVLARVPRRPLVPAGARRWPRA